MVLKIIVPIAVVIILGLVLIVSVHAQQYQLLIAYREVSYLGANGVNVTRDVQLLNEAIVLAEEGNYSGAQYIAAEVIRDTHALSIALYVNILHILLPGIASIIVVAVLVMLYLMRDRVIGRLMLRLRRNYRVVKGNGKRNTLLFDEEVLAVIAAIIVVFLVFLSFYPAIQRYAIEPYAAIAFLGPNGTIIQQSINAYPGEPINVSVYVYNGMGKPIWFVINIYITNTSFIKPPLNVTPTLILQRIVLNNETWVQDIPISLNGTGSYRLFATLWMYNPNNLKLEYLNTYVYVAINVTKS